MGQQETRLVGRIRKAILEQYPDAWAVKVHGGPYQTAGIPDLIACVEGRLIGLEAKYQHPGESEEHARGRTTARQQAQIDAINAAGGVAATVLSPEEALRVVERGLTGD